MNEDRLNGRRDLLGEEEHILNQIMRRTRYLHDGASPLNEFNWHHMIDIDDKAISMLKWRYSRYNDLVNESIRPFKKD